MQGRNNDGTRQTLWPTKGHLGMVKENCGCGIYLL